MKCSCAHSFPSTLQRMEASEDATMDHADNIDLAGTHFSETPRFSEMPRMRRAPSWPAVAWGPGQREEASRIFQKLPEASGSGAMASLELHGSKIDPSHGIKPHLPRRILVPSPVLVLNAKHTPLALHPKPETRSPKPETQNPKPTAPNPKPYIQ